jgi:hypothetical protein
MNRIPQTFAERAFESEGSSLTKPFAERAFASEGSSLTKPFAKRAFASEGSSLTKPFAKRAFESEGSISSSLILFALKTRLQKTLAIFPTLHRLNFIVNFIA